jgi:hypothetical protein
MDGSWCHIMIDQDDPALSCHGNFMEKWVIPHGWDASRLNAILINCLQAPRILPDKEVVFEEVRGANGCRYDLPDAIDVICRECPADAPYALGVFIGATPTGEGSTKKAREVRMSCGMTWRDGFAKPKPAVTPLRAYIAAVDAMKAATAARADAIKRARLEAEQVTASGSLATLDISPTYLDALCAALEHPERVYRTTPRRADMLQRLGIVVEVVYQVPERNAYLAQALNSRDTETEGNVYIRMRVPA